MEINQGFKAFISTITVVKTSVDGLMKYVARSPARTFVQSQIDRQGCQCSYSAHDCDD